MKPGLVTRAASPRVSVPKFTESVLSDCRPVTQVTDSTLLIVLVMIFNLTFSKRLGYALSRCPALARSVGLGGTRCTSDSARSNGRATRLS